MIVGKLIPPLVASILLMGAVEIHPQLNPEQIRQLQQWQQYQAFQAQVHQQVAPPDQSAWTTSYWDMGQNIRLDQVNTHFEKTDGRVTDLEHGTAASNRELSDLEGSGRIINLVLGAVGASALGLALTNFFTKKEKDR